MIKRIVEAAGPGDLAGSLANGDDLVDLSETFARRPVGASGLGAGKPTPLATIAEPDPSAVLAAGSAAGVDASGSLGGTTAQASAVGGLAINVTYDSSVGSAPAGFTGAITDVVNFYESVFTDPITINIGVGWGEVGGQTLGSGALGESETNLGVFSYAQVRAALAGDAKTADDNTALASLPSSDPTGGGNFIIATAEAKALGLIAANNGIDGYVGFGTSASYTFDPNNRAVSGAYDFIGVAEHEISEVMGRIASLGASLGSLSHTYTALDLFRYSKTGVRQLSAGQTAYFSLDGGGANLNNFNTVSGGDWGDWAASAGNDSYDAVGNRGVANLVTANDLRAMDAIGWDRTTAQPIDTPPVVTPTSANITASRGQSFAAASLFTASDPDGDAIAQYDFWDTGGGGGHFVVNGVAQPVNRDIYVAASQLAQTTYQSGAGADTLWVRANDGAQWSPWSASFTVTAGAADTAPVVTPTSANITASRGQSFAASSLFTASDPDGDAIAQYDFWDTGGGGGHFVVSGVAQPVNRDIYVAASQLAQTTYQSGSGADTLWVRASDGALWSPWSASFTVTAGAADTAPVVTPASANITATTRGQSFAASSLFTASDPDGDAIAQYDFWDTGGGGGHFVVNGVAQPVNRDIYVAASQLAQTTYQSGGGGDTLWVRANDGAQWSPWSASFTVTGPADAAPVVTPTSANITATSPGQSFAASALFTASDPDGDAIAQYDFWDTGAGGGHFAVNGAAQPVNRDIYVAASQLAQTTYQSGAAADTLWVRASDGALWSPWSSSFTVTGPTGSSSVMAPMTAEVTASPQQSLAESPPSTASASMSALAGPIILTVGPTGRYQTISAAVSFADADANPNNSYDIQVTPATYTNDFPVVTRPMTIEVDPSATGAVVLLATVPLPNKKGIILTTSSLTVRGLTFQGAAISNADGGNGAGIRDQNVDGSATSLIVENSLFTGNQEGILTGDDSSETIKITNSSFKNNGNPDPGHFQHALYVNYAGSLTVTGSLFGGQLIGHDIKSRALVTNIANNRIYDGAADPADGINAGSTSYGIDLPDGGTATISGNLINQGPATQNSTMVDYGAEGLLSGANSLFVSGNTFISSGPSHAVGIYDPYGVPVQLLNNSFEGVATPVSPASAAVYLSGGDTAPVVTPASANITASRGQSFAASSLFTASDPDGDAIAEYDFWDTGGGGGRFVVSGVAQPVNRDIYVAASQLAQTTYQSGSGADTLWVRASDGALWSPWSASFTVTAGAADTAPVVTPASANITATTRGQSFAASSLFTASDPDGDAIAQYDFWDTGGGGGRFVVNGVAQPVNRDIYVAASQLAQTTYQSGSGADTLWVRANDGAQWSPWSASFTVTGPADAAPVVTPTSANITATSPGQSFAASALFTASDPDGDAIAQYDFWDTGAGGGHFAVNGAAQPVNRDIFITASQLAQTTYQSGASADTLWVRASDGALWSPWSSSFTVTGRT